MHEATKKLACRCLFVSFAALPFFLVVAYSVLASTSWYHEYQRRLWESRLSSNIGMDVRLGSIEFVAPYKFKAERIRCLHPETGNEVAKISSALGLMDRVGWSLELFGPELNGERADKAIQVFHDWFLCRPQKSASVVKIAIRDMVVHSKSGPTRLKDVEIKLKPTESLSQVIFMFAMVDQPFNKCASLQVERNHAARIPNTNWRFNSPDIEVPCAVLADRFPVLKQLGASAMFRGKVDWSESDQKWDASVQGIFRNVQFESLTDAIGAPMQGIGELAVDETFLRNGQILHSSAIITAERGTVRRGWLQLMAKHFQIPNNLSDGADDALVLANLKAKINFSANRMELRGLLPVPRDSKATWAMDLRNANGSDRYWMGGQDQCYISMSDVRDMLLASATYYGPATATDELSKFLANTLPWPSHRVVNNESILRTATGAVVTQDTVQR